MCPTVRKKSDEESIPVRIDVNVKLIAWRS